MTQIRSYLPSLTQTASQQVPSSASSTKSLEGVSNLVSHSIEDLDRSIKQADSLGQSLVAGDTEHLHETFIALTKAELALNLQVQIRNKCLEAYQEIMRLQI